MIERDYHARCRVCNHPDRVRIELALARGAGLQATARMFALSKTGLHRHWHGHVPTKIKQARRISYLKPGATIESLMAENKGVLDVLKAAQAALFWRFDSALQMDDDNKLARLHAELHRNCETVARLTGELVNRSEHVNVSLVLSEEWLAIRHELARVLRPHPEIAVEVAEVFRKLERPSAAAAAPRALALEGVAKDVSHAG